MPPGFEAEAHHLVEDEEGAEAAGEVAQGSEERALGGDHAGRAHHRFDDDGGDLVAALGDDALGGLRRR